MDTLRPTRVHAVVPSSWHSHALIRDWRLTILGSHTLAEDRDGHNREAAAQHALADVQIEIDAEPRADGVHGDDVAVPADAGSPDADAADVTHAPASHRRRGTQGSERPPRLRHMQEAATADAGNAAAELTVPAAENGAAAATTADENACKTDQRRREAAHSRRRRPQTLARLQSLADAVLQARAACCERSKRDKLRATRTIRFEGLTQLNSMTRYIVIPSV